MHGDWDAAWQDLKTIATNLVDMLVKGVGNLFTGMLTNTLNIIRKLVDGLVNMFVELGNKLGESIDAIVADAIEFWGQLADDTVEIFQNIWDSIVEKVTGIKDAIVEGIGEAVAWIEELPAKALTWGADMIDNFINGIKSKISSLTDELAATAEEIAAYLGFSEPEKGALADFHTFAPDMVDLFTKGIRDGIPEVRRAAEEMADAVAQPVGSTALTFNISNTINGAPGQNINDLAAAVDRRITASVAQKRSAWA